VDNTNLFNEHVILPFVLPRIYNLSWRSTISKESLRELHVLGKLHTTPVLACTQRSACLTCILVALMTLVNTM
jgi:hypothetical protein